jgi:hypothetical protein
MMVHSSVPVEAYGAIERAAAKWNQDLGREIIRIDAWGVSGSLEPAQDGYSMIYWLKTWDSTRMNEQARTTIYWQGDHIFEADMRLNNKDYQLYTQSNEPVLGVDLESLVVHEMGHVLGLAHTDAPGSVMNVSLASGQTRRDPGLLDLSSLSCEY